MPCTDTFNYTIQQPMEISAEFTVSGLCDVGDSADISTIVYGGTPPYTYSWSTGGVTTASIEGLVPGWYGLTITDLNNCISSLPNFSSLSNFLQYSNVEFQNFDPFEPSG